MNKTLQAVFVAFLVALSGIVPSAGGGNPPQTGKIISENSVDCGTKKQGKKEEMNLVCQEYVVRTATTEYHIRQPKQKDQAMLPLNSNVEFEMDKDKMKLKVNGKKYEFLVVSEGAAAPNAKQ